MSLNPRIDTTNACMQLVEFVVGPCPCSNGVPLVFPNSNLICKSGQSKVQMIDF